MSIKTITVTKPVEKVIGLCDYCGGILLESTIVYKAFPGFFGGVNGETYLVWDSNTNPKYTVAYDDYPMIVFHAKCIKDITGRS